MQDSSGLVGRVLVVQVVQPWRELGFSALDDDLPLTTLLTCVSTEQQADRWPGQGGLGGWPPNAVTGWAGQAGWSTRLLPQPRPGRSASGTNMPRGPAVKPTFPLSFAGAGLCYQAIPRWPQRAQPPADPTLVHQGLPANNPKITIPTSRPEQQQDKSPRLLARCITVSATRSITLHIQLTWSPLIHHLYLPCSVSFVRS